MSNENEVEPSEGERCPDCGGRGYFLRSRGIMKCDGDSYEEQCTLCDGTGEYSDARLVGDGVGTGRQPAAPAERERDASEVVAALVNLVDAAAADRDEDFECKYACWSKEACLLPDAIARAERSESSLEKCTDCLAHSRRRIATLESQLAAAIAESDQWKRCYDSAHSDREDLFAKLAAAKAENERLTKRLDFLDRSRDGWCLQTNIERGRVVALEAKLSALTAEAERMRSAIERTLKAWMRHGTVLEDVLRSALAASADGQGKGEQG